MNGSFSTHHVEPTERREILGAIFGDAGDERDGAGHDAANHHLVLFS